MTLEKRGFPGCRHGEVWNHAGKVEGGSNRRLKPAHKQIDVYLPEKGGRLLEHLQSGAVDIVDAGQIDDNCTQTIGIGLGENMSQFRGRGVGHSPFHRDHPHGPQFLAGGPQKPDNPRFPAHVRAPVTPVTRQPKRDKLTDFPTFQVLRCI